MADDEYGASAPIDRPVLELPRERLLTTEQVATARITDKAGHLELLVTVSADYYPDLGTTATVTVRWYTNDDFSIHYQEERRDGDWACR